MSETPAIRTREIFIYTFESHYLEESNKPSVSCDNKEKPGLRSRKQEWRKMWVEGCWVRKTSVRRSWVEVFSHFLEFISYCTQKVLQQGHLFEDILVRRLWDFVQHIDGYLIVDTGLTQQDIENLSSHLEGIEDTTVQHRFIADYSEMKNLCIKQIKEQFGLCWILMPDDSWSLHNFDRKYLEVAEKNNKSALVSHFEQKYGSQN